VAVKGSALRAESNPTLRTMCAKCGKSIPTEAGHPHPLDETLALLRLSTAQRNRRVDVSIKGKPVAPSDCSAAQRQRTDLARAAAVHYMRTKLGRKEPVPTGVECFDPPAMPYVCDVRFSNNMVIEVEVRPEHVKVILSQADNEPGLVNRAPVCKFTYRCPPSGGFVFRDSECTR
jgi:hypothetical protein